ncbi:MAG: AAA family ATPase [Chloroflexi bacterium]|nr:AAA family ATPase [Chloroflexota bacterium]
MSAEGFGQERRLVTVLFADFVGFTALAEELDAEELQQLVSGIFEALAEQAIKYDGTIEKFIGDAIFVIFGAPIAHEDDPQRARRTALAMQRVFAEHAARAKRERGIELGLRIGVHTGIVVAGAVRSTAEYGVMGDTVNTASRLQSEAAPGESYVTQSTFRLTQREFSFREVGPIEMKGKEKPVLAYALTGERSDVRPSIELNAPLVGRWMELSRLDLAYQSARVGRTEVFLISGEAGIGKSRLVSEFIGLAASDDTAAAADRPRVMRWTFSRVNQRSYAGFVEPLLVELGIDPSAPDGAKLVQKKLAELRLTSTETAAPLLAQFLHLQGADAQPNDSEEWKRATFLVVFDTLVALARERPVLYVLEDLHYADPASLELLWFVSSRASRVPLLILLAQRVGAGGADPTPLRTNFTQLVLEPLPDEEAARIVESTVEWVPAELRDRIVARAGGNPFFIEESIRSLVESGAVTRDEQGDWRLVERASALEVPATLHAVIAARLDRLTPNARECIQLASVIGQRFGDRVLRAAGGDHLAEAVDALIAADLVLEAAPGERREGRYRFKHAVTQEVAYNTLLVRRRVELHKRVAAAYEQVLGGQLRDFYPALAHHYLLGDVPEKAAEYAWKAAQRAVSIHAHVEALRLGEQAAELFEKVGKIDEAVHALFLIARVHRYRGENDAALAAYERALALLEARQAPAFEIAAVYAHMAELCTRWDAKHPDLDGLIERGLALVGEEHSRERVLLLAAKAFLPRKLPRATDADWEASLRTAKEALAIAEELGLLREVSLCLDAVGWAYRELGNHREAYAQNQRRVPIAQSLQDSDELIDAHTMLSISSWVLGNLQDAIEHAEIARELALATEKPRLGLVAVRTEAASKLFAGDFNGVLVAAARADRFAAPRGQANILVYAMAAAAALASPEEKTYRDRLVEAEPSPMDLSAGDFLASVYGQRESESAYLAIRSAGYPWSRLDRILVGPLAVLAAARWGIDDDVIEERVANDVERAESARGHALLTQAQGLRVLRSGENARAEQLLLDAVQAFTTLRLDYERAVAQVDRARALEKLGQAASAAAELDEARRIAERIGAVALRTSIELRAVRA